MLNGKPLLAEFFCGTKSIGKEFKKVGFEVITLDFDKQFEPDIHADILTLDPNDFRGCSIDFFWASPPCNAFSVAVIGKNWYHDHTPKNDTARLGLKILEKTVEFIKVLSDDNPDLQWGFENPRGKMRKMPIVQEFKCQTVSYCQYGDTRMKPTDIWTNTEWVPRPMCKSGDGCHEAAPRGSKTGTQGIKGSRDRAIIPAELCAELAAVAVGRFR